MQQQIIERQMLIKKKTGGNIVSCRFLCVVTPGLLDEAEYLVDVYVIVVLCLDLDELAGYG